MNTLNNKSRTPIRKKIEPSSRDSITTWLDVLTAMLVMPDSQRLQVRDELEDHLRSRVDDLLIMGKSEPEAIRIAVAELGETAELAKLITHAHTKSIPRRKIMNAALVTVALAGMSFGGFSFINGTGAPSSTPSNGGALPVIVPDDFQKQTINIEDPEENRVEFSIEEAKFVDAFGEIAEAFDLVPALSATMLKRYKNHDPIVTLTGEYTLNEAMDRLLVFDPYGVNSNAYYIEDEKISITDPMVVIRKETSIKTYSLAWANRETAKQVYITLREIVGNGQYSQFFEASFIGNQLAINARKQAHEQVVGILADAKAAYEVSARVEKDEREIVIERVSTEYQRVRDRLISTNSQMGAESMRVMELQSKLILEKVTLSDEEKKSIQDAVEAHSARHTELEYMYDEYKARYDYLRSRLIDSQYAELFKGLE